MFLIPFTGNLKPSFSGISTGSPWAGTLAVASVSPSLWDHSLFPCHRSPVSIQSSGHLPRLWQCWSLNMCLAQASLRALCLGHVISSWWFSRGPDLPYLLWLSSPWPGPVHISACLSQLILAFLVLGLPMTWCCLLWGVAHRTRTHYLVVLLQKMFSISCLLLVIFLIIEREGEGPRTLISLTLPRLKKINYFFLVSDTFLFVLVFSYLWGKKKKILEEMSLAKYMGNGIKSGSENQKKKPEK